MEPSYASPQDMDSELDFKQAQLPQFTSMAGEDLNSFQDSVKMDDDTDAVTASEAPSDSSQTTASLDAMSSVPDSLFPASEPSQASDFSSANSQLSLGQNYTDSQLLQSQESQPPPDQPQPPSAPAAPDTVETEAAPATEAPAPEPTPAPPTELDKYWMAVREDPGDFTGWTYLLQYVEQECSLNDARTAFEDFLGRYPYCYGYWKKYADLERKNNCLSECEEVFEKGVKAISLSIDLWVHFITFAQERYESDPDKETKLRRLYERAVTAAGIDFRSDKLWDMYLFWEQEKGNLKNITKLYDRILTTPTQMYAQHMENFSKHVQQNHPRDILSLDEFLKLRQKIIKQRAPKHGADDAEEVAPPAGQDLPPGMEPPPGVDPSTDEAVPGIETSGAEDEAEIAAIKEQIIESRQSVYKLNEQEVSRRWTFEEGIRRPYFHVKPLEKTQLKNWRDYLDFEMENGSHGRSVVLFERCLIACALYEEFWLKYAKFLEPHGNDAARAIYRRACNIYLRKKPSIHLAWASFEEKQGKLETALEILGNFEKEVSNLTMVSLRLISLQRRRGQFDHVDTLYKKYIEQADSSSTKTFYSIKYARYQAKVLRDIDAARETLNKALESDQTNAKLMLQLLDLEYQQPELDEGKILSIFEKSIDGSLAIEHRIAFSQRRMEFMEDFSSSIARVQQAYDDHQKLLKELSAQNGKKRKADAEGEAAGTEKKSKTENVQGTSNGVTATTTADYNQNASQSQSQQSHYTQSGMDYSGGQGWNYGHQQWNTGYNTMPYNYNPWGPYNNSYYG